MNELERPVTAENLLRDTARSALVLWDLQQGLGGRAPRLAELAESWRRLRSAAHASDVLVVRSRHTAPPPELMDPVLLWRIGRRSHGENRPQHYMQPGSEDHAFIPGFEPASGELVIDKSAPSLFHDTEADSRLRAGGIRTIVLAGVATDIGIDFTARHALAHGYFVVIAEDAVGSYTQEAHDHAMAILRSAVIVASSSEIAEYWAADRP
jgi:nicotinamidase-related amidase